MIEAASSGLGVDLTTVRVSLSFSYILAPSLITVHCNKFIYFSLDFLEILGWEDIRIEYPKLKISSQVYHTYFISAFDIRCHRCDRAKEHRLNKAHPLHLLVWEKKSNWRARTAKIMSLLRPLFKDKSRLVFVYSLFLANSSISICWPFDNKDYFYIFSVQAAEKNTAHYKLMGNLDAAKK